MWNCIDRLGLYSTEIENKANVSNLNRYSASRPCSVSTMESTRLFYLP